MIQRIQSLFMLLASGVLGLEFVFPFATSAKQGTGYFSDSVFNVFDNSILLGLVGAGILLSLIAIFLFKNRKLQTSINWFTILLCIAILGVGYLFAAQDQTSGLNGINIGIGTILPLISLVLLYVANRFIGKDESLVKSMDRLR